VNVETQDGSSFEITIATHAINEVTRDQQKLEWLIWCHLDFRYFLNFWWFLDQERQRPTKLGTVLWEGQEQFIQTMKTDRFIFALKARKLGFTTLDIAYDAWCARFRGQNERVHLFSRREDAANELLGHVKYGLDRLPDWMKLPYGVTSRGELHLIGGPDDKRIVKAYPADEDTAVEATCTHGHVDEWARMRNPQRVWQAIEPSMANTCHIITTGMGPGNFSSEYWLKTKSGDTRFNPFFVPATARPDRPLEWVLQKRREMPANDARREYPLTDKDSLYAGADLKFSGDDLEEVGAMGRGLRPPEEGKTYIKAWDIGRHADAAVCTIWDPSEEWFDLVGYYRLRQHKYPMIQQKIAEVHLLYPGVTVVEKNAAGEAVMENIDLPEHIMEREFHGHFTSGVSKARMISQMEVAIQNHDVGWLKDEVPQLHSEMDAYQIPDDRVIQDSVMSACIALDYHLHPTKKRRKGRARILRFS
jgi:hypothetical protein